MAQKVGDGLSPRTGRPKAEKPKTVEVKARIDEETNTRLEKYCEEHAVTRTDVVRKGIETVLGQKK
ncbi:CopG family transcriptional regulator [Clostridium phoceensis]|uniref:CopG family transcriptional regulator n=1 Tax=Clostridium phoceensis TaxID=1650661 RepID=UPI00265F942B|nr:CopG family transcriptional regulator [Clostridium phoceensis]